MEALGGILIGTQLVFTIVAGLYFYTNLKSQQGAKSSIRTESKKEVEKLRKLRDIKLSEPLSEKTRPKNFGEIIGQEKGISALRAALCGANPQHVIIYGPPGIGKTAAARVALENAKKSPKSPFKELAPFVEMDATILQFDERSIADPLIGSVHDPIYQGAGAYGAAGIPQPKAGAVTKAHGGVLFLDEIGELHQLQMNKLLKVLEDRKVFLSSSYYSSEDPNIPNHIHDIFKNGLPADFRLVGATTRTPEEIPPAIRSRCAEIFFRPLNGTELALIAKNGCKKAGFLFEDGVPELIAQYSANGRDTVNIVQMAAGIAAVESRTAISINDVESVIDYGRYSPKYGQKAADENRIGIVNGLAVYGMGSGAVMEIEVISKRVQKEGTLKVTGIVEEEEMQGMRSKIRRPSTARASVENVITAINRFTDINTALYDIHVNFPGGAPVDGPSAGIAILAAIYSSIKEKPISGKIALTGEVSIKGKVLPVGGVAGKLEGADEAGIETVLIPKDNHQKIFCKIPLKIITVENIEQVICQIFGEWGQYQKPIINLNTTNPLTAKPYQNPL